MLKNQHIYSLADLVEQNDGKLLPYLQKIMKEYVKHITQTCQVRAPFVNVL